MNIMKKFLKIIKNFNLKMNNLTVYTITYNEEIMLPFFIKHYRKLFPNCEIVIYDNESTDNTVKIAKENNCIVLTYSTNNQLSDSTYLKIKNNCWKDSNTKWNLICDCDELCEITLEDLKKEDSKGTTIIQFEGYDMVNRSNDEDNIDIENIKYGVRNYSYDKTTLFNKEKITDINYAPGCHSCYAHGEIIYPSKTYRLLHYKYIGQNFLIDRYKNFNQRLSQENKNLRWGIQYTYEKEKIIEHFKKVQKESTLLI